MPVLSDYRNILNNLSRQKTDINCDLGEGFGNDELIIPVISSANIACGYHAGDINTMQETIDLCSQYNVLIGAHPSFYDKENFGRKEFELSANDLYELIIQQLFIFKEVADTAGQKINHVKPHGALYNLSARDATTATIIANAVKNFDPQLCLYGLSGSHSVIEANKAGLKTRSEVFADRTYQDDGSLTPRSVQGALITDEEKMIAQVLEMINTGSVTTLSGKKVPIIADTVCIHGDGKYAAAFGKAIQNAIR